MNKTLIAVAVAVAGALGAPGVAFAQTSTVQIYGRFAVDYGVHVRQPNNAAGASRHDADMLDSQSSRLGFKGEENLGGGLSAWFQCESQLNLFPADDPSLWCGRNSALGLKGGLGNVYIGSWDSPIKVAFGTTRMTNNSGFLGTRHMMLRGPQVAAVNRFNFSVRHANSVNYESPQFGGFQARAQYTAAQNARNQVQNGSQADLRAKRRNLGLGADYSQGPVTVAAAWAKHEDFTVAGRDDTGWALGATYKIGEFKGGITYTNLEKEPTATTTLERRSWNLALEYDMSGPGSILLVYTQAGDFKGTVPVVAGPDTGAEKWMIGYNHSLSKRTVAGVAYVRLNNDTRGTYGLSEDFSADVLGGTTSALVLSLVHRF